MRKCLVSKSCLTCHLEECRPVYGCIKCNSKNIIRWGFNRAGSQRWQCKDCKAIFVGGDRKIRMIYENDIIREAVRMVKSGSTIADTTRYLRIESPLLGDNTVGRWCKRAGVT